MQKEEGKEKVSPLQVVANSISPGSTWPKIVRGCALLENFFDPALEIPPTNGARLQKESAKSILQSVKNTHSLAKFPFWQPALEKVLFFDTRWKKKEAKSIPGKECTSRQQNILSTPPPPGVFPMLRSLKVMKTEP